MADKVTNLQIYVLGERNFPLSPIVNLRGGITDTLGEIAAEAQRRLPGTSYEDVLRLLLAVGLSQVETIFEAGGRIEAGGRLSFTPVPEGRKAARMEALRAKLLESGVVAGVSLGERQPIPEVRAAVNTIPVPPMPTRPPLDDPEAEVDPTAETEEQRAARLAAGQEAALP